MSAKELASGGNKENGQELVPNSNGLFPADQILAQKDQEIAELKRKVASLEAEHMDLRTLVEEHTLKMMTAIESSVESERRAVETNSRLEEILQELSRANSTVSDLEQERRMFKSVASRAAELETHVVRLQHDLITSVTEKEETSTELQEMRDAFEAIWRGADAKDAVIKGLEVERDSLKAQTETQRQKLEVIMRELEKCLLESKSKLDEEKRALEKATERLKSLESKSKVQEERIKTLETQAKQSEIERERATQACTEKQVKVGQLSRELDELRSQLEKSSKEKRAFEEQSVRNDLRLREENEVVGKKLVVEVERSRSKQEEIMVLEKKVSELNSKLEAVEIDHKSLVEKHECYENKISKTTHQGVRKFFWPATAAASTGTLATAALVAYLKYSRQR